MRINRIEAMNVLGLKEIDIKIDRPILLVAGHNGSAKSSVADVLELALTRQMPRGVDMKKSLGMLVNDTGGTGVGGAAVTCDDGAFSFALPKGRFEGPELPASMKVALRGQRFSSMTPDERRTFLFDLTDVRVHFGDVKERLLKAACDPVKIEEVLPTLRTGFPDAAEYAKEKAKAAKTLWGNITGGTWGSKIGESWAAPVPRSAARRYCRAARRGSGVRRHRGRADAGAGRRETGGAAGRRRCAEACPAG